MGLIMIMLVYWDDSSTGNQTSFKDYFKLFVTTSLLSTGAIYVHDFNLVKMFTGGGTAPPVARPMVDDFQTGLPDF